MTNDHIELFYSVLPQFSSFYGDGFTKNDLLFLAVGAAYRKVQTYPCSDLRIVRRAAEENPPGDDRKPLPGDVMVRVYPSGDRAVFALTEDGFDLLSFN